MKFTLAGQVIDPKSVGYRSLGFGEALAIAATPYELRIRHSELPPDFLTTPTALPPNARAMTWPRALSTSRSWKRSTTQVSGHF